MPEFDRLDSDIEWIDLSFVKRQRTPEWAIQVDIRCHLLIMSLRYTNNHLESLGVSRSHVAIHNWVHKAELQPVSTVTEEQIAVDEKMIRINGDDHWLYGAIDPKTNEVIHLSLFPATTNRRRGGFWTSFITSVGSMTPSFSSTVRTISGLSSTKTGTDSN